MSTETSPGPARDRPDKASGKASLWWAGCKERCLEDALAVLADGRWHPHEEFGTRGLIGIDVGRRRGLLEIRNNGAQLIPGAKIPTGA